MKLLIIAYYFPPFGGGSIARVHSFVKYLPSAGITPTILTAESRFYENYYLDNSLLADYDSNIEIYRAGVLFGSIIQKAKSTSSSFSKGDTSRLSLRYRVKSLIKMLLVPDEQIFWAPKAIRLGSHVLKKHKIDAILASGPPFTTHLVGAYLSRRFDIPLLLDYRDLWTKNVFYASGTIKNKLVSRLERYTIDTADKIIVTNEAARYSQCESFGLEGDKSAVIENGFDAKLIHPDCSRIIQDQPKRFRIRYIGSMTRHRTPEYFLKAMLRFLSLYSGIDIEISFIGYAAPCHQNLVKNLGLDSIVHFSGAVSRERAIKLMLDSEILLLLQRESEGGSTAIPGKLYEYLASGIPVLTADERSGPTTEFLKRIGVGFISEFTDIDAIFKNLETMILKYAETKERFIEIQKKMEAYSRKSQVYRLAGLIGSCS